MAFLSGAAKSRSTMAEALGNAWSKTKQAASDAKKNIDLRLTMEGLLTQARISLQQYLDPKSKLIPAEQRMSRQILRDALGVAFITEAKGGFIFGVKGGSGVIVLRKGLIQSQNENQWTAPCAIGTGGLSVGFQAGAAKVDHIIVLTQKDQVDMFLSNGQLQIKGSANATAAKYGRNVGATLGVGSNTNDKNQYSTAGFYTYSFGNKGIHVGVSLEGEVVAVRKGCNEEFYGESVTVKDILTGLVPMNEGNEDYVLLTKLLNDYCSETNVNDDSDSDELDIGAILPPEDGQNGNDHDDEKGNNYNLNINGNDNGHYYNDDENENGMVNGMQQMDFSEMQEEDAENAAIQAYFSGFGNLAQSAAQQNASQNDDADY